MCALFRIGVFPRYFSYLLVFLLSGNTARQQLADGRRQGSCQRVLASCPGLPYSSNSHSLHGFVQGKNKCFLCLLKLIKGGKTNFFKTYFSGFVFDSCKWRGATPLNSSSYTGEIKGEFVCYRLVLCVFSLYLNLSWNRIVWEWYYGHLIALQSQQLKAPHWKMGLIFTLIPKWTVVFLALKTAEHQPCGFQALFPCFRVMKTVRQLLKPLFLTLSETSKVCLKAAE